MHVPFSYLMAPKRTNERRYNNPGSLDSGVRLAPEGPIQPWNKITFMLPLSFLPYLQYKGMCDEVHVHQRRCSRHRTGQMVVRCQQSVRDRFYNVVIVFLQCFEKTSD